MAKNIARGGERKTTIGLIGSGDIGSTVARLAVAAGHDVVLSNSRVVVTVPLRAYREVPVEPLAGKVVIDTNNYYPERDGVFEELEDGSTTTGELLQKHLPEARVVKGLNNIWVEHLRSMARPAGSADRSALPIAGDDATAKQAVTELFGSLGFDTVDAGPLAENWRTQRDTPAYVAPYGAYQESGPLPGTPANAQVIREALAAAKPTVS